MLTRRSLAYLIIREKINSGYLSVNLEMLASHSISYVFKMNAFNVSVFKSLWGYCNSLQGVKNECLNSYFLKKFSR